MDLALKIIRNIEKQDPDHYYLSVYSMPFQGRALRKTEGSPLLWTCEIQCAQHMIFLKKLSFSSRPRATGRRQGPLRVLLEHANPAISKQHCFIQLVQQLLY